MKCIFERIGRMYALTFSNIICGLGGGDPYQLFWINGSVARYFYGLFPYFDFSLTIDNGIAKCTHYLPDIVF